MAFRSQGRGVRGKTIVLALLVAGCGPALAPLPVPVPSAPAPAPAAPAPVAVRVALPARVNATTWRVSSIARLKASGAGVATDEQRVESRALVSWSLTRSASGGLRGTGQVDSFTIASSLDTARSAARAAGPLPAMMPAMLLVEATVDSAIARVSTRPPLANECDRPEASAATLARELLVRIPDGVAANERWRDSTATLVCRSGVPLVVYTTTWSTLESISSDKLVVKREITTKLEGKGGSAFRALELSGTGTGTQRVEVRVSDGSLSKIEGASVLTLQLRETSPPAPTRNSQLVQRTEFRAERLSR